MKRWGHGHSLVTGGGVTLLLVSYRIWIALAMTFLAGCAVTLLFVNGRRLLRWSRDMVAIWKLDKQDRQRERLVRLKRRTGIPY